MAIRINDDYDHLFEQYGQAYNVDPLLIKTVFHLESAGNPNSRPSSAGAQGGMQIMPKLAAHYGIDPHDITQAIPAAAAYLAEGLQATGGNPAGALAYYNGGPKTLHRLNPETQGYLQKAFSYYPQMRLMGSAQAATPDKQAPDAAPDDKAFRDRWGMSRSADAPIDDMAFRERWSITTPPKQSITSDAAASRPPIPDKLGDTETTTAQMAAQRAQATNVEKTGYSALEPSEPGFAHLLWSVGKPLMDIGETARGLRPIPQGIEALAAAAPLAGVGRFGDVRFGSTAAKGAPVVNPLEAQRPPLTSGAPGAVFDTPAGRMFDVDPAGNVTPRANPLATTAPETAQAAPINPLVVPDAVPAPAATGKGVVPLSPAEKLGYASIKSEPPPSLPGTPPLSPGAAPPGTPPPGVPGYTPTTPGVSPSASAGLSPAEAAAYASMRDAPPPAPMIPPMTKAAAEKFADQIIQHFHTGNPPTAPDDLVVPPGYHPTLTGLTTDPGLATLHRGLESISGTPAVIAQHNAQAINSAAHSLQGNLGDAANMESAVKSVTGPKFEAAFANKTDMDPAKVQAATQAADEILAGKNQKRPGVVKYVKQIRDAMNSAAGNKGPESDPEMFHGVQQAINDLLSPIAQNTDAAAQAASASLMKLKPLVQAAIESGAPGFKAANDAYAAAMKPVDAQKFLESLNLTNATGDVRLQAVDSAIKNIQKQQQLPGVPKAKWVTDEQMGQLVALRNALRMEAARGAGKPINSTTFQNLATNSRVSQIAGNPLMSGILGQVTMPGVSGFVLGEGMKTVTGKALAHSEQMVREALLERILNFSGKGEATLAGQKAQGPRAPGAPWNPLNAGPSPAKP